MDRTEGQDTLNSEGLWVDWLEPQRTGPNLLRQQGTWGAWMVPHTLHADSTAHVSQCAPQHNLHEPVHSFKLTPLVLIYPSRYGI